MHGIMNLTFLILLVHEEKFASKSEKFTFRRTRLVWPYPRLDSTSSVREVHAKALVLWTFVLGTFRFQISTRRPAILKHFFVDFLSSFGQIQNWISNFATMVSFTVYSKLLFTSHTGTRHYSPSFWQRLKMVYTVTQTDLQFVIWRLNKGC